jgi:uncharacterized protein (TIGR02996 family)
MTQGAVLQGAIVRDPGDDLAWLALADWLEEDGQAARAELLRLTRRLRDVAWDAIDRPEMERRVVELLRAGVEPANPELTDTVGMRFRLIPPGRFLMGSADDEEHSEPDERPRHEVTLTRPFWMGVTPVTQRQFKAVIGGNPSHFSPDGAAGPQLAGLDTADFPVEYVSWEAAQDFCRRLTAMSGEAGRLYRLPSEAEWEYACRAGAASTSAFHFGDVLDDSSTQANFWGEAPYGSKRESEILERTSGWGLVWRMPSGCTTCTATSGSGAPTATTTTITPPARPPTR